MNLSNINTTNSVTNLAKMRGFTIVELLIVIVVIGILAAIVIVAYNGVQNRAKVSSAQSVASTVVKKAEAFNAQAGYYPTTLSTATTGFDNYTESKLTSSGVGITNSSTTPDGTNGTNTVQYRVCSTGTGVVGGVQIRYWDYSASTPAISTTVNSKYLGVLNATNFASCTAWNAGFALTAGS